MKRRIMLIVIATLACCYLQAKELVWFDGKQAVTYKVEGKAVTGSPSLPSTPT